MEKLNWAGFWEEIMEKLNQDGFESNYMKELNLDGLGKNNGEIELVWIWEK